MASTPIHNSRPGDLNIGGFVFPAGKAVDVPQHVLTSISENSTFRHWAEKGWLAPVKLSDAQREKIEEAAKRAAEAAEAAKQSALDTNARDEQGRTQAQRAEDMQRALSGRSAPATAAAPAASEKAKK